MKHKFNVSPVETRVAGWEASRVPYRIGAPKREIGHRAAIINSYNVAGASVSKTYARSGSTDRKNTDEA